MLERIEPLQHIIFRREPEQNQFRRRRGYGQSISPRPDRRQHAERLKAQANTSSEALDNLRRAFGILPGRLMILRLETLEVNQREALERFGITIVEELQETTSDATLHRLLVQFPDEQSLNLFKDEYDHYASNTNNTSNSTLPHGMRRNLFDSLDSVSTVTPEERLGRRLHREGVPTEESFFLDVDLWNPGTPEDQNVINAFRSFVQTRGGRVHQDPLVIPSLILAKVEANRVLLDDLLRLDLVALVDLPPAPLPEDSFDLFQTIDVPDILPQVSKDGPLACIVDSGIVPGHPLLREVLVDEVDFDSGENTAVDMNGHGTNMSGFVVYGDIAHRMQSNDWDPQVRICSAKVLRNEGSSFNPGGNRPVFPDEERVEGSAPNKQSNTSTQNMAVGYSTCQLGHSDRIYTGGRQLPWAELLDELAKTLDILIIISAGNAVSEVPCAINSPGFQQAVIESLRDPDRRLIDPATAALCLTVGSIARRDDPHPQALGTRLAAVPQGCPSPFTRRGPGVSDAIKPELVAPGGNFAVDSLFVNNPRWIQNDPNLVEPTLNRNFVSGSLIHATNGTSVATAQVTHIAARMEASLRDQLNGPPSQNLVRALLVNSAQQSSDITSYFSETEDMMSTAGYGQPNVEFCWSLRNRVSLISEDEIPVGEFHVYSLILPELFLNEEGKRSISVSLAYDPPTRLSRRDYIANSMRLDFFGGLTTEQVINYRAHFAGSADPPIVPDRNRLNSSFTPSARAFGMSTVQKRIWRSNQGTLFLNRRDHDGNATLQIVVRCRQMFRNPLAEDAQRYALVVTLAHDSQSIDLYQEVRANIRTRQEARVTL